jgi:hypothetical protein
MAHVKPRNCQSWDVHGNVGFNIGMAMEHHRCFHIYIVKKRATRISDLVFFEHQYITNPQLTPETLVLKAASELTSALKGMMLREAETADALAQVSKLFHKIAEAKAATEGKRATEHSPYPPLCLPSGTTSKGAHRSTHSTSRTPSKGAGRSPSG